MIFYLLNTHWGLYLRSFVLNSLHNRGLRFIEMAYDLEEMTTVSNLVILEQKMT